MTTTIPTESVAVVIIDMQNAYCHPAGSFGRNGLDISAMTKAIDGCARLLDAGRAAGFPVVFTRAIHLPGLADWKVLSELPMFAPMRETGSCEEGSFDAEVVEELKIGPNDLLFNKSRYSPFVETDIEAKLRALGVENLIVGGVGTSVCVESSVRDAAQREFRTFVVEEAVGDISAASNQSSLHMMGTMFGWTVSVDDVVAAWS